MPGLTAAEDAARLARNGPNVLPEPGRKGGLALVGQVLREPMLLLLVAAALVYMLLGDAGEAALLLASVALVIGLTLYQEYKSERALQALRDLGSPRARVLRDGAAVVVGHPRANGEYRCPRQRWRGCRNRPARADRPCRRRGSGP